jgi:hypothetical protein
MRKIALVPIKSIGESAVIPLLAPVMARSPLTAAGQGIRL